MLVFGIDPGSNATGYAAVSRVSGRYALYDAGVIRTKASDPVATRLLIIHRGLRDVIRQCKPDAVAIGLPVEVGFEPGPGGVSIPSLPQVIFSLGTAPE